MTTAERILDALKSFDLVKEGESKYRSNSPLRPGSNSHAFTLTIGGDGEHGAYTDHVSGDTGSLYELADHLKIERPKKDETDSKRSYTGLKDYVEAHGVTVDVFEQAGWRQRVFYQERAALPFSTETGMRYRFIDGNKPSFKPAMKGYTPCWYGLKGALRLAQDTGQPLVICNGEPSTVVAQHFGVSALAHTAGENKEIPQHLADELQAAYSGPVLIALDCDETGRAGAMKMLAGLRTRGYDVRAVDLNGGKGFDLADFARLHQASTATALQDLNDLGPATTKPALKTVSLGALLLKQFAPIKWAVPNLIPEGLTLFAGRPKMGKSWLALSMALAVASGGRVLGQIAVDPGAVLYLALEDPERRLQSRVLKLLDGQSAPSTTLELVAMDAGFPRLDDGGLDLIEGWLRRHENARLIIIDTLAKVRTPTRGNSSVYEQDYNAMHGLLSLAARRGVAVIVVHHTRKSSAGDALEEVSGSFGLSGGVDGVIVLKRDRGSAEAVLAVTGRDVEEQELALMWDAALTQWTIAGEAAAFRVSKERQAVLDVLKASKEGMTPKDLAAALGKEGNAVRFLLHSMVTDGQIETVERGRYVIKPRLVTGANNANNTNTTHITNGDTAALLAQTDEAPNTFQCIVEPQTAVVSIVRDVSARDSANDYDHDMQREKEARQYMEAGNFKAARRAAERVRGRKEGKRLLEEIEMAQPGATTVQGATP